MNYVLRVSEDTVPVEVDIQENRQIKLTMDQKIYDVAYTVISDHQIHLRVNGRRINVFLADESVGCKTVMINGMPYRVEDVDALARQSARRKGPQTVPQDITPPTPAVVVRLLVSEGDTINKGEGVIVLSAMKMETTLTAPYKGRVSRINVSKGDQVSPGQILVDIEKEERSDVSETEVNTNAKEKRS